MYPMGGFGWGWGSVGSAIASLIVLAIFLIPLFFFLLNLRNLLDRVQVSNRAMPPNNVWLNFIPVFNLGWAVYTVMKVRDSVNAEYRSRGWAADGDFGYGVGFAAAVLAIATFFLGWIPVVGWVIGLAWLVCWILYWLKESEIKSRLGHEGMWRASGPQGGYGGSPYVPPTPPPYAPQPWPGAQQAPPPPYQQPFPGPGPAGTTQPQWQPQPQQPQVAPQPQPAPQPTPQAQPGQPQPGRQERGPEDMAGARAALEHEAEPGAEQAVQEESTETRSGGTCAACGTIFSPSDQFCRTCGMKLP